FWAMRFLYEFVCGNHIVWGASDVPRGAERSAPRSNAIVWRFEKERRPMTKLLKTGNWSWRDPGGRFTVERVFNGPRYGAYWRLSEIKTFRLKEQLEASLEVQGLSLETPEEVFERRGRRTS